MGPESGPNGAMPPLAGSLGHLVPEGDCAYELGVEGVLDD